jgi:sigma-B regulation protein RsbU (phosphoserine phosphatase)
MSDVDDSQLRRIESVTDAALAHLDIEDLLGELLDRVRELLEVDTAAVLLLDSSAQQLVVTAARGIEAAVRQVCVSRWERVFSPVASRQRSNR